MTNEHVSRISHVFQCLCDLMLKTTAVNLEIFIVKLFLYTWSVAATKIKITNET